jgi:hypothetical protein
MQIILANFIFIFLAVLLFMFGIYSLIGGIQMYRSDKIPSYMRELRLNYGSPKKIGIGIVIRGIFAILFSLIIVLTTFIQ